MKKFCAVLTLCLLAAFITPAFSAEKVLKVGVYGPLTGPQALVGGEFKNSTLMAFEETGYKIGDYKLELVWIDCQYDPAKGSSAYSEAIDLKGVDVGILNWGSSVAVATMDLVSQYKIPHLFGTGAASVVNDKYDSDPEKYAYWSTKSWPIPGKLMIYYVDALESAIQDGLWGVDKKVMAIFGEDSDWGRSCGSSLKKVFEDKGWKVVSTDYFPTTQTDFYGLLSRYKSKGVRLLAGSTQYPAMGALVKQAKEIDLGSVIIADGLGWVGNWHEMTGSDGEGLVDMIPMLSTDKARAFAKEFEARTGKKPGPATGGLGYDLARYALKIFKRAHEKHGELNSANIQEVVASEVHTGKLQFTREEDGAVLMAAYKFSKDSLPDMEVGTDGWFLPVLQYKSDGSANIIYPPEIANAKFKDPKK